MSEKELDQNRLKFLLDEHYTWPDYYHFKFIVKESIKDDVLELFREDQIEYRSSNQGKYLSITVRRLIYRSDEVLAVYTEVSKIKGVITL
jgi:putative lipoic acid-binding regulatory protein